MLKVLHYGLGPIGIEAARISLDRPNVQVVGAVDVDEAKVGKDISELLGLHENTGVTVRRTLDEALQAGSKPDVVVHTTGSFLDRVSGQIEEIVRAGINVVSSTEELLYPAFRHAEEAARLDSLAKQSGVTVLGTGVNPGFIMDTLAVCMTGVCRSVEHVYCERFVDASTRRGPLQKKIGAGLAEEEFRRLVSAGKLGHIGMIESIALLAAGAGLEADEIKDEVNPMVASRRIQTQFVTVEAGRVAGIRHTGWAISGKKKTVEFDLRMYVGCEAPHDLVRITGDPPVSLLIEKGTPGDIATVAMLINMAPKVAAAPPGLLTMLDIPVPSLG